VEHRASRYTRPRDRVIQVQYCAVSGAIERDLPA
jgi:hypothetical protein